LNRFTNVSGQQLYVQHSIYLFDVHCSLDEPPHIPLHSFQEDRGSEEGRFLSSEIRRCHSSPEHLEELPLLLENIPFQNSIQLMLQEASLF
jgi:hypothetical protein